MSESIEQNLVDEWAFEESEDILHDDYFRDEYRDFKKSIDEGGYDKGGYEKEGEYYQNLINLGYSPEQAESMRNLSVEQMHFQNLHLPSGYNQFEDFPTDSLGADGQIVSHPLQLNMTHIGPNNPNIVGDIRQHDNNMLELGLTDHGHIDRGPGADNLFVPSHKLGPGYDHGEFGNIKRGDEIEAWHLFGRRFDLREIERTKKSIRNKELDEF